ncbi:MAG TPA: hypothetical protein DEA28_01590, partial [Firmicutes bacterium]|nr:hypothetical protein [Bacillota bacterium]
MNKVNKMEKEELKKILKLHTKWLNNEPGGKCADLRYANLSGVDLSGADLRYANLMGADLSGANLIDTNLSGINLSGANLIDTNLNEAENYRKGQILKN